MKYARNQVVFAGKTIADLERLTADLDRPFAIDETRPLTPAERALWEKAKRRPGRPRIGKGAQTISVSVERSLLEQTDRLARKRKVTRARIVAEGLQYVIARFSTKASAAKARRKAA